MIAPREKPSNSPWKANLGRAPQSNGIRHSERTSPLEYACAVRDRSRSKGAARSVLYALASRMGNNGFAFPSLNTLAMDAGVSRRTVVRAIKSLEKMGEILVTRPKTGCFHTNHYIIMIDCGRNGAREHQTGSNIESNTKAPHLRKCDGKAPASDTMSPAEVTWSHLPSDTDAHGKRKLEIHKPVKGKKERELPDRCRSSWGKRIPEIRDYSDIHDPNEDPISIAISITGEKTIRAWGYWVKMLKKAQDELGKEKTERLFRGCLVELWGKMKAGECNKPGAMLNILLQETFEARYGGDKGK